MSFERCAAWLTGIWAGILACIGAMAAPAAFATLATTDAGRFAGRLFAQEAYLSLVLAVVLFGIERRRHVDAAGAARGSAMSSNVLLILGTLFCTVAGYFALLPLMDAARSGQGRWSFGTLHAVSGSFFVVKGLLVAVLAWRLAPGAPVSPVAIS